MAKKWRIVVTVLQAICRDNRRPEQMKNFNVKSCNEKGYKWVVRGKIGSRRTRKYFHVKQEAQTYADRKNIECTNQGMESLEISTPTRIMAQEAEILLKPFGKSIKDAVAFYVAHLQSVTRSKSVAAAVTEFLDWKFKQKKILSFSYRKDLRNRLGKFSLQFGRVMVASMASGEIQNWLNGMKISPISHDNYHRVLSVFFEWAKKSRLTENNPIEEIRDPEPMTTLPGIFTPQETSTLLNASSEELLPYLAFSLFCGIRPEEFHKQVFRRVGGKEVIENIHLDWTAVNLGERSVTISAELAKTNRKRIVTIPDNLVAWIAPRAKQFGPVAPRQYGERLQKLRKEIKWTKWPHDVLRHCFCTYHLALHQNENLTALQAGHSVKMLQTHYDAVAPRAEGEAFFAIKPAQKSNLVPFVAA